MSPLFLDTTIQIERVVGSYARQQQLRAELAGHQLMTSTYVLSEYLRTLVKDAVQLHQLITQYDHLDEVMTALGNHINKREASRMILMLGRLLQSDVPLYTTNRRHFAPLLAILGKQLYTPSES